MLDTVLLVASVILLALAGLGVARRVNVGWLGMALFVLTFLV